MVGRDELPNAVALNASLFNASRVVGPGDRRRPDRRLRRRRLLRDQRGDLPRRPRRAAADAERTSSCRSSASARAADDDARHPRGLRLGTALARNAARPRDRHRRQHGRLQLPRDPAAARLRHAERGRRRCSGSSPPASAPARSSARCCRRRSAGRAGKCSSLAPAASASHCSRSPRSRRCGRAPCSSSSPAPASRSGRRTRTRSCSSRAPDHLRGRVVSLYLWAFAGLAPIGGLLAGWLVRARRHAAQLRGRRSNRPGDDVAGASCATVSGRPPRFYTRPNVARHDTLTIRVRQCAHAEEENRRLGIRRTAHLERRAARGAAWARAAAARSATTSSGRSSSAPRC